MRKLCGFFLILTLLLTGCGAGSQEPSELRRKKMTIDLGEGFTTRAELTYPATGDGPWPTVILFHGSGPVDMDATYSPVPGTKPISANFKLLAERLGAEGIAVVRFHKRGVKGYGEYDMEQVMKATTNQLIRDAGAVIAAAQEQPEVDDARLYLYGWSQGAQVAAHTAAAHPDLAGMVLQGPPTSGWSEILRYQHITLGLPQLKKADEDGDGSLAVKEWFKVQAGPAALMGSFYVWAPDSTPFAPKLRPDTDRNGDKLVDLEGELRPAIEAFIQNPSANPFMNPANEPSRSIAEVLPGLNRPVLILHGEADGWVPVTEGEKVAAAAPDQVTLKRYPGLGHALSPVSGPAEDSFGVMDEQPIRAMIDWIAVNPQD